MGEGPTPVSSLLHSSTMVVAGVYLIILISVKMEMILLIIIILSSNITGHFDVKKNIAYSTSIHLLVILLLSVREMYYAVVSYILLHRIVKRQIFQSSGYTIHRVGNQDIRKYVMNRISYMIILRMFLLSAMVRMVIVIAKELVVFNLMRLIIVILVFISYIYTIVYINKSEGSNYVGEFERFYVVVLIVLSMSMLVL